MKINVNLMQTMADLEQRWRIEVDDRHQDHTLQTLPFFHDYHIQDVSFMSLI